MKKLFLLIACIALAGAAVGHAAAKSTPSTAKPASCCDGGACCNGSQCCH